jgi:SAM-dependent methyltransferase
MKSLAAAGFDTWGFEPSEPFRDYALAQGIDSERLQLVPIETADYAPESFNFITFGAVLEHLFDPRTSLQKAMHWLKPGGIIQVEVPSSNWLIPKLVNAYFRLRGTNYVTNVSPMHSPFHLYEFTLRSFRDFEVAESRIDVCQVVHSPRVFRPTLRRIMEYTGTGMQLTVYLRKRESD